jgi:hypothetical protein
MTLTKAVKPIEDKSNGGAGAGAPVSASAPTVVTDIEYNPWDEPRPEPPRERKLIALPGGRAMWVELEGLAPIPAAGVMGEAQKLIEKFCPGDDSDATPEPFYGPDGSAIELNPLIVKDAVFLQYMDTGTRKSFIWWIGLADRCYDAFTEISTMAGRLNRRASQQGN